MRRQAWHDYMNQCYDYKKFVGLGIIHEFNENNYSSAYDMGKLSCLMMRDERFKEIVKT